jgi:hypothetical protein
LAIYDPFVLTCLEIIIIIIIIIIIKNWKNKAMHGQYIRNIDRQLISKADAFLWLTKGDLTAETKSEIVAAQDQALQMKYCATKILNTETESCATNLMRQ